jgi:CO/xanthine dehydrogenase Mo-binding subunit
VHAGGCYRAEHARISVSRVYTNNLPGGQMRAPGEPQGFFAAEWHIDCVARKLGMDPYEFRMKNLMEEGDVTLTGGHYRAIKANDTLKAAARAAGYSTAKGEYIGRGVAMGYRGPGGGTTSLKVELGAASSIVIQTSFFEQGTGTYTTLRQIVAEELGCDPEEIQIKTLDTDPGVSFRYRPGRQPRHSRCERRGVPSGARGQRRIAASGGSRMGLGEERHDSQAKKDRQQQNQEAATLE